MNCNCRGKPVPVLVEAALSLLLLKFAVFVEHAGRFVGGEAGVDSDRFYGGAGFLVICAGVEGKGRRFPAVVSSTWRWARPRTLSVSMQSMYTESPARP